MITKKTKVVSLIETEMIFQIQLCQIKSLEVLTPIITTNWTGQTEKSTTFLGSTRELRLQGKLQPPNLKRQVYLKRHNWDLLTYSRKCWNHNLIGTLKWQLWRIAEGWVQTCMEVRNSCGLHFCGLYLQVLHQVHSEGSRKIHSWLWGGKE